MSVRVHVQSPTPRCCLHIASPRLQVPVNKAEDARLQAQNTLAENVLYKHHSQQAYIPIQAVAKRLAMPVFVVSKLSASMLVQSGQQRLNLGLSLKFDGKGEKV